VARAAHGHSLRGVAGVVEKDLCSALLAREIDADCLLIATDVMPVYAQWVEPGQQALGMVSAQFLMQQTFPAGSRGPKVQGAGQFVQATGRRAVIGKLDQFEAMPRGTTGLRLAW